MRINFFNDKEIYYIYIYLNANKYSRESFRLSQMTCTRTWQKWQQK